MDIDGDFVIDQLQRVCSDTKLHRNDIAIVCPFHNDNSPSCMVHTSGHKYPVGVFHCWSCGASGSWRKLAERLGLESGENYVPNNPFNAKRRAMERAMEDAEERMEVSQRDYMPPGHTPWEHGGFRGLPEDFLVSAGARRMYDDKCETYRILFPVTNKNGNTRGSIARRTDDGDYLPWLNSPGPWARQHMFPMVLMQRPCPVVVLVEGPWDALRLNFLGIPALSILGTQNWSRAKLSILQGLGVKKVIICMDGDKAGRKAEAMIFNDLDGEKIKRKRFRLPIQEPSIDPGNMNEELVEALREFAGV